MRHYSFIIILIIGFLIGLLFTAQYRSKPNRVLNPLTPYASLSSTRDQLMKKQENYKEQIKNLNNEIEDLQFSDKNSRSENKEKFDDWKKLRLDLGLTEIISEGVIVTMDDSNRDNPQIDSITHAADLRDVVNMAWANNAQAISINSERLTHNTSIDCIINTILINNTKLTTPFQISIIGDSEKLKQALEDDNKLVELHQRIKKEGLVFRVEKSRSITIPAFKGNYQIISAQKI